MKYSDRLSNDHVAIFLLHGVIEKQTHFVRNYTNKHITKDYFYQFLYDLSQQGSALSMHEITECIAKKRNFPKKSFAITFDDGFENNFSIAMPILKEFQVPAMFYVTTNFIDRNTMSWIDRIEFVVEASESGILEFGADKIQFNNTLESKKKFLSLIRMKLKSSKKNLNELATEIQRQLGFHPILSSNDPLDKKMGWEQLARLQQDSSLFTIGAHTHTHPVLSNLTAVNSENEIKKSVGMISEKLNFKCTHFSYPEGLKNCYSDREITILKKNGIVCSPSAEDGVNSIFTDLFHLKRIMVC